GRRALGSQGPSSPVPAQSPASDLERSAIAKHRIELAARPVRAFQSVTVRGYLDLLAIRRYRLLWIGDTLSSLGDSVGFLALIWLVYSTAGSAATLGGFVAVYTAPVIVGGPLAGAALDRFDRRRLMIADNVVRGMLVASLP